MSKKKPGFEHCSYYINTNEREIINKLVENRSFLSQSDALRQLLSIGLNQYLKEEYFKVLMTKTYYPKEDKPVIYVDYMDVEYQIYKLREAKKNDEKNAEV